MKNLTCLVFALSLSCQNAPDPPERTRTERPSFVLLLADDLGWGELGSRGHPWMRTPALDGLARDGVSFERFYAAAPVCSPTRASLLTGRHPNRMRCFSWGHELPAEEWTLAEALAEAGYATGHFGKWHLGSVRAGEPTSPGEQGFETWASAPNFFDLDPLLSEAGEVVAGAGESSDVITEHAVAFLRRAVADGRPFLAVVWYGSPHLPHVALESDLAAFEDVPAELAAYCAEVAGIDRSVERLRSELETLGVADDTLLWFASDNGPRPPAGPEGSEDAVRSASTGGLRGVKGTLWEGGVRVPSLVLWPGELAAGRSVTVPASTVDVLPTCLDLAGVPLPSGARLDGVSLVPLLEGGRTIASRGLGFWVVPAPGRGMHSDRILELMRDGERSPEETPPEPDLSRLTDSPLPGQAAWIEGNRKLLLSTAGDRPYIVVYDLEADPRETIDLARDDPGHTSYLLGELERWRRAVAQDALEPQAP